MNLCPLIWVWNDFAGLYNWGIFIPNWWCFPYIAFNALISIQLIILAIQFLYDLKMNNFK